MIWPRWKDGKKPLRPVLRDKGYDILRDLPDTKIISIRKENTRIVESKRKPIDVTFSLFFFSFPSLQAPLFLSLPLCLSLSYTHSRYTSNCKRKRRGKKKKKKKKESITNLLPRVKSKNEDRKRATMAIKWFLGQGRSVIITVYVLVHRNDTQRSNIFDMGRRRLEPRTCRDKKLSLSLSSHFTT